jgi:putative ABC transport system permease protein
MRSLAIALPLAWSYLHERLLSTMLNIVLLALGVGTITAMLLTLSQSEQRMERDAGGIDLVVGAKGSPLQLILSAVFHVDIPTGNIPLADARKIAADPMVKRAVPVSLGDSYRSFRLVGTEVAFLDLYDVTPASGRLWTKPMEVFIGAEVAKSTGLGIGSRFAGSHGLSAGGGNHEATLFEVVGIAAPTGSVMDRLILTSLDSVWEVHEHGTKSGNTSGRPDDESREITALLIQYATPLAAVSFPRRINAESRLQAASPAMETARLFALVGVGVYALKMFAAIIMGCAGLGIFVGLMNALDDRRADLALLRLLGADRTTVFLTVVAQGFALGISGVILGIALGHGGVEWAGKAVEKVHRVAFTGLAWAPGELWVAGIALGLSLLAGLFPAWRAYRQAVPELLGRN